ncbi:MAG TPA: hypothetical protein PKC55_17960 [Dysgonomonas sp.]|uniref:Uncharacterized protein n=1 Tax=Dysgonomonas mossii TaxID=163665 RepID=A0A4Y9IL65_9BACT|nr:MULTISPECIES: hypothetical protein [Dysgonomonas]MBF0761828.1 hypothetical protein [Dysgonomonas mossii]TFU88659.1 hypothetical protein E4T88_12330 [Dysgonomonas mossii]HML66715.1 hypothetical protein [Dysgonomonas sp.]
MIVAYKEGCDYDPNLDYQNYSKVNYQILGFSQTEKNSVQELRKYAPLFNGTKYLESENIHAKVGLLTATSIKTNINTDNLNYEIVDYSEKAIALFGDTKEIKDLLKAMGGKFNPRLIHRGE